MESESETAFSTGSPGLRGPPVRVGDPESHLGFWVRVIARQWSTALERGFAPLNVTVAEWIALREIYRYGRSSPMSVGKAVGINKGAASKVVRRLVQKDLAFESFSEHDFRVHTLSLTAAGEALVPTLAEISLECDRRFFGSLHERVRNAMIRRSKKVARAHGFRRIEYFYMGPLR